MQETKKMCLVDQRTFEKLNNPDTGQKPMIDIMQKIQRHEDMTWSKPPIQRSKTFMHKDMKRILDDPSLIPVDKVKLYSQNLIRFLNTNKDTEDTTPVVQANKKEKIKLEPVKNDRTKKKMTKVVSEQPKVEKSTRRSSRKRKPNLKWESVFDG